MAGTAISDIMEATDMAKGGIYGNFESKEAICSEAFTHLIGVLTAQIGQLLAAQQTAKGKLFALLDFYMSSHALHDKGGCPILNFGIEADDTNPAMRARVAETITRFEKRISQIVQKGKETGEFIADIDEQTFAIKMFAMIEGSILIGRVQGNTRQMKVIARALKTEIESFCA